MFSEAVNNYKLSRKVDIIKVYEKIRSGIWTFNGYFKLVDYWLEESCGRNVFKFRLEMLDSYCAGDNPDVVIDFHYSRIIPSSVKREVWARDKGQCVWCGSKENLHFDHIIPFSKGGSSLVASNVQLLCARHNLEKHDRIE